MKGTKAQIFNLNRARKSVDQNLRLISGILLPMSIELSISSLMILYFCGPIYFFNLIFSLIAYLVVTKRLSKDRKKIIQKTYNTEKKLNFLLTESLSNYYNVKAFNSDRFEMSKYTKLALTNLDTNYESMVHLAKINMYQKFIIAYGVSSNLLLGVLGVWNGVMSPGDLVFLNLLMTQTFLPLFNLGNVYRGWHESFVEINELMKLLSEKNKVEESKNAVDFNYKEGRIEIKNLHFSYEHNIEIIKNLNVTIEKGEVCLITGPSGIGKSTFVNLLFRLFEPNKGDILIDGQNIKDLKFSYRDIFSLCSQNHIFFNDSIVNNLRMANINKYYNEKKEKEEHILTNKKIGTFVAKNENTEEEIINLTKELNLYNTIMDFDEGFDYNIGDGGNRLSGGERQRLNLIRTFLKDSQVYIFDEPTNFLDSFNKRKLIDKMKRMKEMGKTIIIISHNPEFDDLTDKVICFGENGSYEYGSNQELLSKDTKYKKLRNALKKKIQNN